LEFETMARKLSLIARRITRLLVAGAASLAATTLSAQSVSQTADSPKVFDNPFLSAEPQLQVASEPPAKPQRSRIAYQNPFAATSKSPPVDTSLRPGPISRWRHPVIPGEEPSAIKSAMVAALAAEPSHPKWDQLPPAEDLRTRIAARGQESDPTFFARFTTKPNPIQFTPKPLTQPNWLTENDEVIPRESRPIEVSPAVFSSPLNAPGLANQIPSQSSNSHIERSDGVSGAFTLDTSNATPAKDNVLQSIIPNGIETPTGWLEQAQHAAKGANSPEELSSVVEFCDRGLRSTPDEKLAYSLRRLSAWAHNRRGELLADDGRADDALRDFQVAISLDGKCSLAIHNRAVTFAQQNQFEAALRDFNRVIELNPGLAVAYRNRAELLAALGRMEEAIRDYNQALESLPTDAQLYRDRAYAYQQLGDIAKSLADFNHALEIAPKDPDAMTQRGNLYAEQGNFELAVADFQQALANDPKWIEALRSMAWLEATCPNPVYRDPQAAIGAAEQAAKLAPPNDYLILDTLAAANASVGIFEKAKEIQLQALANAPPEAIASLKERLELYSHGQAFRNVSTQGRDRGAPDKRRAEVDTGSEQLR
jgi:tetratricopeptide (TPR) repeat protein